MYILTCIGKAETGAASKSDASKEAPEVNLTEEAPKVNVDVSEAKASGTDEPPPAEAGKKEEVQKETPVVENGKDEGQLDVLSEVALVGY